MANEQRAASIATLGLSTRVEKGLLRNGVSTVDQLTALSESDILSFRNFGLQAVAEIKSALIEARPAPAALVPRPPSMAPRRSQDGATAPNQLGLSRRTRNALAGAGICTGSELRSFSAEDLFAVRGIGPAAITEIEHKVGPLPRGSTAALRLDAALAQLATLAEAGIDLSKVPVTWLHAPTDVARWLQLRGVADLGSLLELQLSSGAIEPRVRLSVLLSLEELMRVLGLGAEAGADRGTRPTTWPTVPMPLHAPTRLAVRPLGRSYGESRAPLHEGINRVARKTLALAKELRVLADDPRLGGLLRRIDPAAASLRDLADKLLARWEDPPNPDLIAGHLRDLNAAVERLVAKQLEEELFEIASSGRTPSNSVEIAVRTLGWDGEGGATLQRVADERGITRERVRQIRQKVLAPIEGKRSFAPALDRALLFVEQRAPSAASGVESALAEVGISSGPFRLEGLEAAARWLGRTVNFRTSTIGSVRVALSPRHMGLERAVVQAARKAVEHWGATTVAEVAARITERSELEVPPDLLHELLPAVPGFAWLDRDASWFWLASVTRNRVLGQVRKILSVCSAPIPVRELREGVARHHRMGGYAPPSNILLEICRRAEGCVVEGGKVVAHPPLPWSDVLDTVERAMVAVLTNHGPVMRREELQERCLELGMNRSTFYVYLGYSPVIQRLSRGVYGLRGAATTPGLVESLLSVKPGRPRRRVLMDYGWASGRPWAVYCLSPTMLSSGVFGIPAGLKRFVDGEFVLWSSDGARMGTIVSRESGAWGLGPFFHRRGGESGDFLRIEWDLKTWRAEVSIGDAGLAERQTGRPASGPK